jgi:putative two-component system response regulator
MQPLSAHIQAGLNRTQEVQRRRRNQQRRPDVLSSRNKLDARLLVVDDEEVNVRLLERMLARAGYTNIETTTDPRQILDLLDSFSPDLILLDLLMPHLDGFEVLKLLGRAIPSDRYLPVLILTADASRDTRSRALSEGARDFLTKPFDMDEVLLRIANMLDVRFLQLQLEAEKVSLEDRVQARTRELEESYVETFERLALAAEYRDDATGQHTRRVGRMAALLAAELSVPPRQIDLLERAAGLHDVGKIGIPDSILLAPRKLTTPEFEVVKTHTVIGAKILSGSRSPLLAMAEEIAWSHHERWDGRGYGGITGDHIPLFGRITTVADVFDALTHERPYKPAWSAEDAIEEIDQQRARQFDPEVVDAFMKILDHVIAAAEPEPKAS